MYKQNIFLSVLLLLGIIYFIVGCNYKDAWPPSVRTVEDIEKLPSDHERGVRTYNMGDEELEALSRLTKMKYIYLRCAPSLSSEGAQHLGKIIGLMQIVIEGCPSAEVANTILKVLAPLPELRNIMFSGSPGVDNEVLASFINNKSIDRLSLNHMPVDDTGITYLSQMKNLKVLHLRNTWTTDKSIPHFLSFKKLEALGLSGSNMSEEGIKELKRKMPNCEIYWVDISD